MTKAETLHRTAGAWLDCDAKRLLNLAALAWAAMLFNTALVLEYGFGLAPCALCMTQRLFVVLAGLCIAAGLVHNPRLGVYPLLALLASVAGAYFAVRHLYLLWLPADQQPTGCGMDLDYMIDAYPLVDLLRAMTAGTGECTDQGAAIPALALVGFFGMAALTVAYWKTR